MEIVDIYWNSANPPGKEKKAVLSRGNHAMLFDRYGVCTVQAIVSFRLSESTNRFLTS